MSRCAVKFTLLLLLFSTITRAQGLDTGAWPTQDHDNRRSNQGSFSGPTSPGTPQLIYDAGSPIVNELVITSDGKLVLGGCSQQVIANQIVAIDATGKPVWPAPYTLIASNNESPMGFTVDSSGRIYVSAHDCPDIPGAAPVHLYSILPTGTSTSNWPIAFPAMYEPAAIGADGTIYQMDELTTLRALRPSDGSVVWSQNFCCFGQGAIALDSAGNLYATADGDYYGGSGLWSWTSTGVPRWTALTGTGGAELDRLFNTTAISPADVIYVSSLSGTVYAFNTSGSLLPGWPFVTGSATASDSQRDSLAVGGSGTVYIKTVSAVFAINPDGTKKWSYSPGGDGTLSPLAVLDSNENVYFAFGNTVYSLTSSGTIRWTVPLDSPGRLYIGGLSTLYVISASQRVYAINDAAPAASVSLSATALNFPTQTVNVTSTPEQIVVTNAGNASLNILAMPTITGSGAADFLISSGTTCLPGTIVLPQDSCTVSVTFTPTTAASETAFLSLDESAGSAQQIPLSGIGSAPSAIVQSPPSRPVLFVLGFCEESDDWWALRSAIAAGLNKQMPTLFPDEKNYDVYSGSSVVFESNANAIDASNIPPTARFFTVKFVDPSGSDNNPAGAAQVSILNKANELSHVIGEVTKITNSKSVILVAHSMGGLVARAYLENLGSATPCYEYTGDAQGDYINGVPDYANGCQPGSASYASNVALLITLDTPHGGSELAQIASTSPSGLLGDLANLLQRNCLLQTSTARTEMLPSSELLSTLNYFASSAGEAAPIPSTTSIQSVESFLSDQNPDWEMNPLILDDPRFALTENDGVISFSGQSMESSIAGGQKSALQFGDWGNPFTLGTISAQSACQFGRWTILHLIPCLGEQSQTQSIVYLLLSPLAKETAAVGASVESPVYGFEGSFSAIVTIKNSGNVALDSVQVSTNRTTLAGVPESLPISIGNLEPGSSAVVTMVFPLSSLSPIPTSAPLKIAGTYSAGTLSGNWSVTIRSVSLTSTSPTE